MSAAATETVALYWTRQLQRRNFRTSRRRSSRHSWSVVEMHRNSASTLSRDVPVSPNSSTATPDTRRSCDLVRREKLIASKPCSCVNPASRIRPPAPPQAPPRTLNPNPFARPSGRTLIRKLCW